MRFVGASPTGGFSTNARDPSVGVGGHDAEAGRIVDLVQRDRRLARRCASWKATSAVDVHVADHVAVDDEEALVDARVERREADGAGRVERLVLHRVVQAEHPRTRRPGRRRTKASAP